MKNDLTTYQTIDEMNLLLNNAKVIPLSGRVMLDREQLRELERNRQQRLRSYRTLGLCAGAALAILLL